MLLVLPYIHILLEVDRTQKYGLEPNFLIVCQTDHG